MAFEHDILNLSFPAAGDLSARQFYPVALATTGRVNTAGGTASAFLGVLQDDPAVIDATCSVMLLGVSKCAAYGGDTAITPGDALTTNADGIAVKTTTDNAGIIGYALDGTSAGTPEIISVHVRPGRY